MLPVATLPCSLTDLVAVFRPCFTAASFRTFIGLVVGLIGQTRRRTVCGMLTVPAWSGSGITAVRTDSSPWRAGRAMRWDLALTDLIVTHLVPAGAPLAVAVGDTLGGLINEYERAA